MEAREAKKDSEDVNIKHFLFLCFKNWKLFVISVMVFMSLAYFYNWYVQPIYFSQSKILIQEVRKSNGEADFLLRELDIFKNNKVVENEIEMLKSKTLMNNVVQKLNLNIIYYEIGNVKTAEIYNEAPFFVNIDTSFKYDNIVYKIKMLNEEACEFNYIYTDLNSSKSVSQTVKFEEPITTPEGVFSINKKIFFTAYFLKYKEEKFKNFEFLFKKNADVTDEYLSKLEVKLASKFSSVLDISLEDPVPEKAADIINQLVNEYINKSINDKNLIGSNTHRFIKERIILVSSELGNIEKAYEDFRSNNKITNITENGRVFLDDLSDYDIELNKTDIKLKIIESIEKYLNGETDINLIAPATFGIEDPAVIESIQSLRLLELQRQKYVTTLKTDNPLFSSIETQIKNAYQALRQNIKTLKAGLLLSKNGVEQRLSLAELQLKGLPEKERQLVDIQRQIKIKENIFLYLLQKQEETAIALASTVSDCQIIDPAPIPTVPTSPNKPVNLALGLCFGLILPILFLLLKEAFSVTVFSEEEVQKATSVPIIGRIAENNEDDLTVVLNGSKKLIAEDFRTVRTNLQYFSGDVAGPKNILVTSSNSGEGKTFISINLALILALSGKRTVLLELDLRKPKIAKYLNKTSIKGISNYLIGNGNIDEIIYKSELDENLDIIFSGPVPPNPAELIINPQMKKMFEHLKTQYDYIIIDSPPAGLVTDAMIFSNYADISIYVVRYKHTHKSLLTYIKSLFDERKLTNMCVLFNSIPMENRNYGYYAGYGYSYNSGYSYGNGYFADKKENYFNSMWSKLFKKTR